MTIIKYPKGENMISNLIIVLANIWASMAAVVTNIWGVLVAIGIFIGATFSPILGILYITFALVMIDMGFGIAVSTRNRGKGSIESNKIRNSLYKAFFYLMFIVMAFFIEGQIAQEMCFGPKIIFAIVAAVELWSIAANALIIQPNFPFLRLFSVLLESEMAKKLEIETDKVAQILRRKEAKDTLHNTEEILENQAAEKKTRNKRK